MEALNSPPGPHPRDISVAKVGMFNRLTLRQLFTPSAPCLESFIRRFALDKRQSSLGLTKAMRVKGSSALSAVLHKSPTQVCSASRFVLFFVCTAPDSMCCSIRRSAYHSVMLHICPSPMALLVCSRSEWLHSATSLVYISKNLHLRILLHLLLLCSYTRYVFVQKGCYSSRMLLCRVTKALFSFTRHSEHCVEAQLTSLLPALMPTYVLLPHALYPIHQPSSPSTYLAATHGTVDQSLLGFRQSLIANFSVHKRVSHINHHVHVCVQRDGQWHLPCLAHRPWLV